MKILIAVLAVLPLLAQTPAPPPISASSASSPTIIWVACGPSYSSRIGASCAFAVPVSVSQGLNSWTAIDFAFAKGGLPSTTISTGFSLDVRHFTLGSWTIHGNLLTTAGMTQTPTALTASFAAGLHPVAIYNNKWAFGFGYRGLTGSPSKIWNASLGISFK